MSDTDGRPDRPVLTGLIALIAVAAVVGITGGLAVLVGSKVLGLDGKSSASDGEPSSNSSLYLPEPTITSETPDIVPATSPTVEPSRAHTSKPVTQITLTTTQQSVSAMQQISFTGTYPTGEGAILQVQHLADGTWSDFPVTVSVSGTTFSTYIQTGQVGENHFRVIDTDKNVFSNEVVVTVG